MTARRVSLIIVSRHRKAALMRALRGVAQMDHPDFEVIVVADPKAANLVRASGMQVKLVAYDRANISAARNVGLKQAAAQVVAFLDDDAVPEPTWLTRLTAPFDDLRVAAAAGFVRGPSGLAWQWRAARVDANGFDHPFETEGGLFEGNQRLAIKTHGTNCAFRRDALLAIGGFDEGYSFFLDDADVNLRLAARGGLSAIVPGAVVHHGFAASVRRRQDRTPTDLMEIGRSTALFLRRHRAEATAQAQHIAAQRARLLRLMVSGAIEPREVGRLMASLMTGIDMGTALPLSLMVPLRATDQPFAPLPGTGPRPGRMIAGPSRERAGLHLAAREAVERGEIVTVLCLSRGLRPHRHVFTRHGWWEQTGGRFGRSERGQKRYVFAGMAMRTRLETERLVAYRTIQFTNSD